MGLGDPEALETRNLGSLALHKDKLGGRIEGIM